LVSFDPGITQFVIECHGAVDTEDQAGVIGKHTGAAPLWYFRQDTGLTTPGPLIRRMVKSLPDPTDGPVAQLHTLSQAILAKVPYRIGATQSDTPAEAACAIGAGVCQDHAHIFITAARMMGYAARYVSGYLFMADQLHQAASHAWAEIHIDKLGWVGFDISNGISPDDRYIRVATGLDYRDAAPIVGVRMGQGGEDIDVSLQIRAL
jgi:transglutaminase-like putative cysteine protease